MGNKSIKGIIFDMDNTLLQSKINFAAMKKDTYDYIVKLGLLPENSELLNLTTAKIIERALESATKKGKMTEELKKEIWSIPTKYEVLGMEKAPLEPGVEDLIKALYGKFLLVVVTNNSVEAAIRAFRDNNIYQYFDLIVGREMVKSLKPSPDGFIYVLERYKTISPDEWLSVGDAWLDGKASIDVGIKFISYKGDIQKMNTMGVYPYAEINDIREVLRFII
ncbi:MAG TPA: HAD family hydrolase [Clostridiaceae bacterium]|nr:HAD family hydrolase [Clostridiaceae bacterium]